MMRQELNKIERIERYLQGQMSEEELAKFEVEKQLDPSLQQDIQMQSLLMDRMDSVGLKEAISDASVRFESKSASSSSYKVAGSSFIGTLIVIATIGVALLIGAYFFFSGSEVNDVPKENPIELPLPTPEPKIKETIVDTVKKDSICPPKAVSDDIKKMVWNKPIQTPKKVEPKQQEEPKDTVAEIDTTADAEIEPYTVLDFINSMRSDTQKYEGINGVKGGLLVCEGGTKISIPPNAFMYEDGTPVKEPLNAEIIEVLNKADMIRNNIVTTTDEGKLLESGGTIYVDFKVEGVPVLLAEGKALEIEFTSEKKFGMETFYGNSYEDKPVDWELGKGSFTPSIEPTHIFPGKTKFRPHIEWIETKLPTFRLTDEISQGRFGFTKGERKRLAKKLNRKGEKALSSWELGAARDFIADTLDDREVETNVDAKNVISAMKMKWINCDRFLSGPKESILCTKLNDTLDRSFVIFKDINSVMSYHSLRGEAHYPRIPIGQKVEVFVMKVISEDEMYYSLKELTLDKLEYHIPEFVQATGEEIRKIIEGLKE